MLKLKQLQQQKQQQRLQNAVVEGGAASPAGSTDTQQGGAQVTGRVFSLRQDGKTKKEKPSAARLRVQIDLSEMDPVPGADVDFPDTNDLMHFNVSVTPSDGMYRGATFKFAVEVPNNYPYDPPKVACNTLVYHPNIDWEGHVCLNILRADWMPVLSLGSVIFGLMTLFLEPNPDDPLNKEAAQLMIEKPQQFERNVKQTLAGGYVMGRQFPKLRNF